MADYKLRKLQECQGESIPKQEHAYQNQGNCEISE